MGRSGVWQKILCLHQIKEKASPGEWREEGGDAIPAHPSPLTQRVEHSRQRLRRTEPDSLSPAQLRLLSGSAALLLLKNWIFRILPRLRIKRWNLALRKAPGFFLFHFSPRERGCTEGKAKYSPPLPFRELQNDQSPPKHWLCLSSKKKGLKLLAGHWGYALSKPSN